MKRFYLAAALVLLPRFALADSLNIHAISVSPTVDTNIYASGDTLGSKMTFTGACPFRSGKSQVMGVQIFDKGKQSADVDLVLFKTSAPTGTFTDNAAFDPDDSQMPYITAIIPITTHKTFSDNGMSYIPDIVRPIECDSSGNVYGYLISRGTPTYGASDLTVVLQVSPD